MKHTWYILAALLLSAVVLASCAADTATPAQTDTLATDAAQTEATTAVTTVDNTVTATTAPMTEPSDAQPEPDVESHVVAQFAAAGALGDLADTMLIISDTDYASPVVLESVGSVSDVKVLKLDIVMDETSTYKTTDSYTIAASMTNGEKIAVLIDFPGDMSAWGLSYVDNMGITHEHTLYMSGEDGSLVMADGIR